MYNTFVTALSNYSSIIALILTIVIIRKTNTLLNTLRKKTDTDEFNNIRISLGNEFQADIELSLNNDINHRLISKILNDVSELENYSLVLNKNTHKIINELREELLKEDNINKTIIIDCITKLKAICNKKGEFYI